MLTHSTKNEMFARAGQVVVLIAIAISAFPVSAQAQTSYDLSDFAFEFVGGTELQATLETSVTGTFTTEAEIENYLNSATYFTALIYGWETVFSLGNDNSSWDLVLQNGATATLVVTATELTLDLSTPNASSNSSLNSSADLALCSPDGNRCFSFLQRNAVNGGDNTVRINNFDENRGLANTNYDDPFVFPAQQYYSQELSFAMAVGGVSVNGGQIQYSGSPTGWQNNYAESYGFGTSDNFSVEISIESDPATSLWVVGLDGWRNEPRWQEMRHAIRNSNGRMMVFESGQWRASGPYLSPGDVVSIYVNLGVTEYAHNGTVVYSSGLPGDPSNYSSVGAVFKNGPATLGVSIQSTTPIIPEGRTITGWVNATGGVTTWNGDGIEYLGSPTGWVNSINSVPFSTLGIGSEYELNWAVFPYINRGTWVVGLGVTETRSNWRDVDYAIRNSNGVLSIYENGKYIKNAGTLSFEGDLLAIQVIGTQLNYLVNSRVVHSREIPGTEDFYVDTAFKDGEARLINFGLETWDLPAPPVSTAVTDWVNKTGGVSASDSSISFSGTPTGWANSVNSVLLSSLGAGRTYDLTWTIDSDPTASLWVVGIGTSEHGNSWRELDLALRNSNGQLQVYVDGEYERTVGDLKVGDELMIRVSGSCFHFGYNGARTRVLCRNTVEAVENLYINALFKRGAAELGEFAITRQ